MVRSILDCFPEKWTVKGWQGFAGVLKMPPAVRMLEREASGECAKQGLGGNLCVCVLVAQSSPLLCDPMDCSPPGSSVYGTFQERILEGVAIFSSRGSSRPRDGTQVSCTAGRC